MATNLQIDDRLIKKAVKLGRHKTKKAAVTHKDFKLFSKHIPIVLHQPKEFQPLYEDRI